MNAKYLGTQKVVLACYNLEIVRTDGATMLFSTSKNSSELCSRSDIFSLIGRLGFK